MAVQCSGQGFPPCRAAGRSSRWSLTNLYRPNTAGFLILIMERQTLWSWGISFLFLYEKFREDDAKNPRLRFLFPSKPPPSYTREALERKQFLSWSDNKGKFALSFLNVLAKVSYFWRQTRPGKMILWLKFQPETLDISVYSLLIIHFLRDTGKAT